jgi:hypothetical protein
MKYRMISASALPLALCIAGNAVMLRKPGDSMEVELSPRAIERLAQHGAVRFKVIAEPVPELVNEPPAPEPAEPTLLALADLASITTETPPETDAETE